MVRKGWDPFNGQRARQALFGELIAAIKFSTIIETGTHCGGTTEYLQAVSGTRVFSCETSEQFFDYACWRFRDNRNIKLFNLDSRVALHEMFAIDQVRTGPTFFYLDAHWGEDLPLRDELDIILPACRDAVIMIDDFQVSDDPGYGYDDYGPGKALSLDYVRPVPDTAKLFFPAVASIDETGAKRGCLVIGQGTCVPALERLSGLRPV
jgi:hypothetical protein